MKQRQAFGGPLSDKQALRHRLADLATQIEAGALADVRRAASTSRPAATW